MTIERAKVSDADELAPLFDAYRRFYQAGPDLAACRDFLQSRLATDESIVLIARIGGRIAGFAQLYRTFSSVRLCRQMILNDLFVAKACRGLGVGSALLDAVERACAAEGVRSIMLQTGTGNERAQRLYRNQGWESDTEFVTMTRTISSNDLD